jgi:uncharacterized membrane protein YfcA
MLLQDGMDLRDYVVLVAAIAGTLYMLFLVFRRNKQGSKDPDEVVELVIGAALGFAGVAILVTTFDPFWVAVIAFFLLVVARRLVLRIRRRHQH